MPETGLTPIDELKMAADKLWNQPANPVGELMSVERHPRSWSLVFATTAREMEKAIGTRFEVRGDERDPVRWRQALAAARDVNAKGEAS